MQNAARRCGFRLSIWLLILSAGCREPPSLILKGDAGAAQAALASGLQHWTEGKSPSDLQSGSPAVWITDEDWNAGRELQSFQFPRPPVAHGSHWRVFTMLRLLVSGGKVVETEVCYAVELGEQGTSIVRSDFLH